MAGSKSMVFLLVVTVVAAFQLQSTAAQTSHVVGDSMGWNVPTNGAANYTSWASQQNFTVGDSLLFNFTTGQHNVAEVSEPAYGPCTSTNPISITADGPAIVNLTTAGNHYYICTFGSHCQLGQKLTINVAAATGTPPATTPAPTTPVPTTPAPTTPAPGGSSMPPPPRENGASTFTALVPVTFLAAALALFY